MSEDAFDDVEWELIRADIAMEKARLKENGDWAKWEAFQEQTNARFASRAASLRWLSRMAQRDRPASEEERAAWWWTIRTRDLSFLTTPPRGPGRFGWPIR